MVTTPPLSAAFAAFSWWCLAFLALGGFGAFAGLDFEDLALGAGVEVAPLPEFLLWRCQGHQPAEALGTGPNALSSSAPQKTRSSLFIAHPFPLF